MKCPVCQSSQYKDVTIRVGELGFGMPSNKEFVAYSCINCGVLFLFVKEVHTKKKIKFSTMLKTSGK